MRYESVGLKIDEAGSSIIARPCEMSICTEVPKQWTGEQKPVRMRIICL